MSDSMQRLLEQIESGKKPYKAYINPADIDNLTDWPIAAVFESFNTIIVLSEYIPQNNVFIDWERKPLIDLSKRLDFERVSFGPDLPFNYYPSPFPVIETE